MNEINRTFRVHIVDVSSLTVLPLLLSSHQKNSRPLIMSFTNDNKENDVPTSRHYHAYVGDSITKPVTKWMTVRSPHTDELVDIAIPTNVKELRSVLSAALTTETRKVDKANDYDATLHLEKSIIGLTNVLNGKVYPLSVLCEVSFSKLLVLRLCLLIYHVPF